MDIFICIFCSGKALNNDYEPQENTIAELCAECFDNIEEEIV